MEQNNYDTTEGECVAIVWPVLLLRPFLKHDRFPVLFPSALRWVLNLTTATGRLARWELRLLEYDLEVMHRPVIVHQATDALYRINTTVFDTTPPDDEMGTLCVLLTDHMATVIDEGEYENQNDASLICKLSAPTQDHSLILVDVFLRAQAQAANCRAL